MQQLSPRCLAAKSGFPEKLQLQLPDPVSSISASATSAILIFMSATLFCEDCNGRIQHPLQNLKQKTYQEKALNLPVDFQALGLKKPGEKVRPRTFQGGIVSLSKAMRQFATALLATKFCQRCYYFFRDKMGSKNAWSSWVGVGWGRCEIWEVGC
jgi:hypothetical protein